MVFWGGWVFLNVMGGGYWLTLISEVVGKFGDSVGFGLGVDIL